MHELQITERILDVVLKHATGQDVSKVVRIHLRIGALSDLEDEWIQHYIEPVTRPWMDSTAAPFEIQWNRVYTLPDFVRFTHKPHIAAGVQCQECHGDVKTMDRIVPVHEIGRAHV